MSQSKKRNKPVSEKQLEANRANALLSTGAQTVDGRNRSKYNAMRHNLRGARGLLPWESRAEYKAFSDLYIEEYAPLTTMELDIIYDVADIKWSLKRSHLYENDLHILPVNAPKKFKDLGQLELYRGRMQRTVVALLKEFRRMRSERRSGERELLFFDDESDEPASDLGETSLGPTAASPVSRTASPAEADPAPAYIVNERGETCYPSGCPVNIRFNEHAHRHQVDVDLATMGATLPRDMVDYARGDFTADAPLDPRAKSLPVAPKYTVGDGLPPPPVSGAKTPVEGVSPDQMGSFDMHQIIVDGDDQPIGRWVFLPAPDPENSPEIPKTHPPNPESTP